MKSLSLTGIVLADSRFRSFLIWIVLSFVCKSTDHAIAQNIREPTSEEVSLGLLSAKYESGGRGPETVSTGIGDPGGVSYGTYQLASAIGNADRFADKYYASEFRGLRGGTPEFTEQWKRTVAKDPRAFHSKEHEFIKATHYDPQVKLIQTELKVDTNARSAAFKDVVWSCAVQHGSNSKLIVNASKAVSAEIANVESDLEWIKAIYKERGRTTSDGKLVHFQGVSEEWIPALKRRFQEELKDAIEMLP